MHSAMRSLGCAGASASAGDVVLHDARFLVGREAVRGCEELEQPPLRPVQLRVAVGHLAF